MELTHKKEILGKYGPVARLAVLSFILCGIVFPLVVTGFAQVLFPFQANGDLVQLNGRTVGSNLIAQEFNSPIFFHPRPANASASSVDPDITIQDANLQIPRISGATSLSSATLQQLIDQNKEGQLWIFGTAYVNVLRLNLALIRTGNPAYSGFPKT